MTVVYKNISDTYVVRQAVRVDPTEEYTIPGTDLIDWSNDNQVLQDLADQVAQIGNGSEFYSDLSDQINHLRGSNVVISGVKDDIALPEKEVAFPERTGHNVFQKGYEFVADPDAPDGITEHEAGYSVWMKMQGVIFRVSSAAYEGDDTNEGDYMEVELVDVNGVTGYPAGTVLAKFAETIPMWPGREFARICDDAKDIPPTVVVRVRYVSRGTQKVRVKVEHVMRTMPQP